jgi:hypothetical protein
VDRWCPLSPPRGGRRDPAARDDRGWWRGLCRLGRDTTARNGRRVRAAVADGSRWPASGRGQQWLLASRVGMVARASQEASRSWRKCGGRGLRGDAARSRTGTTAGAHPAQAWRLGSAGRRALRLGHAARRALRPGRRRREQGSRARPGRRRREQGTRAGPHRHKKPPVSSQRGLRRFQVHRGMVRRRSMARKRFSFFPSLHLFVFHSSMSAYMLM